MDNGSPVPSGRPVPQFFFENDTFSLKKNRDMTPRYIGPPAPKRKAMSLCKFKKHTTKAVLISSKKTGGLSLETPSYSEASKGTYLSQCFFKICKLGKGSFGEVFKMKSKDDQKFYAVKKSLEKFTSVADRNRKLEEVNKHEKLPVHRNCVRFVRAWEEKNTLYIQTELCQRSLSAYAEEHHDIEEKFIWNCLVDSLMALKNLHDHNLVHMDVKPDNIFIARGEIFKLGDFGLVIDLTKDVSDALEGDPKYLAPEAMKGIFGKATDVFSLGITILELACDLDLPRGDACWHKLRNGEFPEQLENLSEELREVIKRMMEPDYERRPTVDQVLELEFVKKIWQERLQVEDPPEEEKITPISRPGRAKRIRRGLLSEFENITINESLTSSGTPSSSSKRTPVNQCSPSFNISASSISPMFDRLKPFPKMTLFSPEGFPTPEGASRDIFTPDASFVHESIGTPERPEGRFQVGDPREIFEKEYIGGESEFDEEPAFPSDKRKSLWVAALLNKFLYILLFVTRLLEGE